MLRRLKCGEFGTLSYMNRTGLSIYQFKHIIRDNRLDFCALLGNKDCKYCTGIDTGSEEYDSAVFTEVLSI